MKQLSIQDARAQLGDLVIAAQSAGEVTVITRYGKPAAIIAPVPDPPDHAQPSPQGAQ
jgi:prevent-host-death family protein